MCLIITICDEESAGFISIPVCSVCTHFERHGWRRGAVCAPCILAETTQAIGCALPPLHHGCNSLFRRLAPPVRCQGFYTNSSGVLATTPQQHGSCRLGCSGMHRPLCAHTARADQLPTCTAGGRRCKSAYAVLTRLDPCWQGGWRHCLLPRQQRLLAAPVPVPIRTPILLTTQQCVRL
jgi:hypothetical protein